MDEEESIHQDPDVVLQFKISEAAKEVTELKKLSIDSITELKKKFNSFEAKLSEEFNSLKVHNPIVKEPEVKLEEPSSSHLSFYACLTTFFLAFLLLISQAYSTYKLKTAWERIVEERIEEAVMLERTLRIFQEEIFSHARKPN